MIDENQPLTPAPATPPAAPGPTATPDWFERQPKWVHTLAATLLATVIGLLIGFVKQKTGIDVTTIPTNEVAKIDSAPTTPISSQPSDVMMAHGWHNDQNLIAIARSKVPTVFRTSPSGSVDADTLPKSVFQWKTHLKVTGQLPPLKNQNPIGSCVGFGSTTSYERALVCAIASGEPFTFTYFTEEITYAGSRHEIGKDEIKGDDGSVGGWAALELKNYGPLPRGKYGKWDFTTYNPTLCRQLGDSGIPDELEPECAKYKAGEIAQLKSWTDAKKALAAGHGCFTCSMTGFAAQRDSNGICKPSGRWGHCMCLDGYYIDASGKEYGHFDNSWDSVYHTGPVGWGEPTGAGFWAASSVISQMIAEGDSWTISTVKGFPKLALDWFTLNELGRPVEPFAQVQLRRAAFFAELQPRRRIEQRQPLYFNAP